MRLAWYAAASTALAASVVTYAFNQRANFYSAMVYLSQNNLSLMILINLVLLIYGTVVWGLQRLCYGQLRPVEIEQLYEKAWFAVTETCLAMTIFREEVGAWFLVMFTALVTGKVWEWIGEGRVEILEQQPPANPRLFHTRLSISLLVSIIYDTWLFMYAVNTVIIQARPNMMVMFLFEFAILTTCSFRTGARYILSLVEADIVHKQTRQRLQERRKQIRDQRTDILRRRESGDAAEAEVANQEELPNEDDVDEMDIEVSGWESKGQWILSLDLFADFVKLGVYSAFFAVLMMFYGLPIHIMRDLFLTTRSFLKRLSALIRYRKALQDMNRYPDATQEELSREDTCIICREEMRLWDPNVAGAVERTRPKKLPCGHILHFGCLKSWLERQQVCPTCRRSVVIDGAAPNGDAAARMNAGGQPPAPGQPGHDHGAADGNQPRQVRLNGIRMFQFGPLRLGFAQGNPQELAQRIALQGGNAPAQLPAVAAAAVVPPPIQAATLNAGGNSIAEMTAQLHAISQRLQQEMQGLQATQFELQTLYALMGELQRLRLSQQQPQQVPPPVQLPGSQYFQPQQPLPPFSTVPQMAPFPVYPPRANTPSLTRHSAPTTSASIPAGSPDLPEGVVIPQGWTLMPLQRVDGQPLQYSAQPSGTQMEAHDQSHQVSQASGSESAPVHPEVSSHTTGEETSSHYHVGPNESSTAPLQRQTELPKVAAPTPVAPNWGGAAQLFANGGAGPSSAVGSTTETEPKNDAPSESHADSEPEESSSCDKGKAKAVTLEEAEDE
ncbi:uncharacterized protein BCR38DRAFT_330459 [Pseudomassariella vexata]|uniref:RING-type E3 ubiquitin transferase n=1 Tax=Pseudomassariella vexata TaxID=1141098 RepID=A0A1Y2EJP4_9PEZI|nr:uncharacterized protein BCR38DRAFT_330459 [Pseudomassariella vexata]ORY71770.1 hypothetical protein BCR38DRAFT_330459 [Pseudomassariella vexata]